MKRSLVGIWLIVLSACGADDDGAYFQAVAQDSAVRAPCENECSDLLPLDTLHWVGFGPFTSVPTALGACPGPKPRVDTLRYGEIEIDQTTGDLYGTQFVFQRVLDSIRGSQLDGEGGSSRPIALQELEHPSGTDSLVFWTSAGGSRKYEHRVAVTCDKLTGVYRVIELPYGPQTGSTSPYDTFTVERPAARLP